MTRMNTKNKTNAKLNTDNLIKKTWGLKIFFAIVFIYLIIHTIALIYPVIWLVLNSLKTSYEYVSTSSMNLPQNWLFSNYIDVFDLFEVKGVKFLTLTWNSIWWAVGNTVIATFMSCLVAYTVARFEFKAKEIVYGLIVGTAIIPIFGSDAAGYKLIFQLGLYDSPLLMITSAGGYGLFQFLMLQAFFKSLAKDYADAAELDGANQFYIFIGIMMPMAIGPIVALSVSAFIGNWNSYMVQIIQLPSYPNLGAGLYLYEKTMMKGMNRPMYFCGCIICMIPVIIIFCSFQDVFLQNMSIGGLKG